MSTIGILSDTHLHSIEPAFQRAVLQAFAGCDIIIHAGDITDLSILQPFSEKEIYAVHGNMCNSRTRNHLPEKLSIVVSGYSIGICHGAGERHNIEDRMYDLFPGADCIIYGHTHTPVCHRLADTLFINPGSFGGTGRYGATGTYALLHIGDTGLFAAIHTLESDI